MNTVNTTVIDLNDRSGIAADHYAIRHKPSGRFLCWDDTLSPNLGLAMRYGMRAKADLRREAIELSARDEYEVVGLRYQVQPAK